VREREGVRKAVAGLRPFGPGGSGEGLGREETGGLGLAHAEGMDLGWKLAQGEFYSFKHSLL